MSEIELQIEKLENRLKVLISEFESHRHSGSDTLAIDYSRLLGKPISNSNEINGNLGGGGLKIGANGSLGAGQTAYDTGTGFWLEYNNGTPRMSIGNSAGNKFLWDGTTLSITGTITATAGTIGGWTINSTSITDAAGTVGMSSAVTGGDDIRFWAGHATPASAPFKVTEAGVVTASSITATGTINATGGYVGSTTALVYEAQGINCGTTGWIRGGMTDYRTGTGWFIGYNSSAYKMSIGNASDTSKLMYWDGTNLVVNDSIISNNSIFGDGSDGDLTTTGNVTLTADTYYNNLTVGHTIDTAGYKLFVKGTLTINSGGVIQRTPTNGTDGAAGTTGGGVGAAGTGGAALADGSIKGSIAGKDGLAGTTRAAYIPNGPGKTDGVAGANGTAGTNIATSMGVNSGVAGANGQAGGGATATGQVATGGTLGTGGAAGTITSNLKNTIKNAIAAYCQYDFIAAAAGNALPSNGNSGQSGSGGVAKDGGSEVGSVYSGYGGGSGGGGGQGGIVLVFARKIVINTGGILRANGGNGGNGGNASDSWISAGSTSVYAGGGTSGAPGGSAGNGGILIYVYSSLTNSGTIEAAAGSAGTGGAAGATASLNGGVPVAGSAGTTGSTGSAGVVIVLQV